MMSDGYFFEQTIHASLSCRYQLKNILNFLEPFLEYIADMLSSLTLSSSVYGL